LSNSNSKKQVFSTWVDDYSDELLTWASYKLGSQSIAEDLLQDCFMAAFEGYDKFEGRSKPKTWLFSILNRKIADYYRGHQSDFKNYADPHIAKAEEAVQSFFTSDGHWENMEVDPIWEDEKALLDHADFREKFDACLADLPILWQEVIKAKYLQNLKAHEICQDLELSTTNYWQITHRAKLLLKKCIETYWQ
jgi:RNA polymerase sigma-70 factor (TIGR02943 family)